MYIIMKPDELIHYGVRGMKWGIRKERVSTGLSKAAKIASPIGYAIGKGGKKAFNSYKSGAPKRAQKRASKIEKKRQKAMSVTSSARYTYKQRKHLSDNELRARINRLNMEKQLKDLSRGRGFSEPQVISSGRQAASQAIGKYGAKMVVSATLGPEAAAFIKPKK